MAPTTINNLNIQIPSNSSSTVFEPIVSIESEESRSHSREVSNYIDSSEHRSQSSEIPTSSANYRDNANTGIEFSEIELSRIQVSENRDGSSASQQDVSISQRPNEGPPHPKRRCIERTNSWNSKKSAPSGSEVEGIYGNKLDSLSAKKKESSCWKKFTNFSTLEKEKQAEVSLPKAGTPVTTNIIKKAGPYLLGPLIGTSPVKSIVQCLARKMGTDKFYTIKILTLKDESFTENETQDDRQGKMLLHAEYSLLSLLQNQDGVVHHHGFFKVITLHIIQLCFITKLRKITFYRA